jgi:hypothetical protein
MHNVDRCMVSEQYAKFQKGVFRGRSRLSLTKMTEDRGASVILQLQSIQHHSAACITAEHYGIR